MNLPTRRPSRKQVFEAALKLAGMTIEQWRTEYHEVSRHHLNECFEGRRDFGPALNEAISRFIREQKAKYAVM